MFRAGQNTVILGSQTSGADGRVSDIFLPGGIKTWISGFGVYYPDGGQTQRVGIVPDIEVKPTVKGFVEGRDELLEKAIEVVDTMATTIHWCLHELERRSRVVDAMRGRRAT